FFRFCFILCLFLFFFFMHTATTEIYTLSLHDALPISIFSVSLSSTTSTNSERGTSLSITQDPTPASLKLNKPSFPAIAEERDDLDRKSTRLNSSHVKISYAVFCLKKKKQRKTIQKTTT